MQSLLYHPVSIFWLQLYSFNRGVMAGNLSEESSVLIPFHLMQKQAGWAGESAFIGTTQEKKSIRNASFLGIFRHSGIRPSRIALRSVLFPIIMVVLWMCFPLPCCWVALAWYKEAASSTISAILTAGKWDSLCPNEAPDTPWRHSLFSWMFSILLYHFWGKSDLPVACRIQDTEFTSWSNAVFCLVFYTQSFVCSFDCSCFHREVLLVCLKKKVVVISLCIFKRKFLPHITLFCPSQHHLPLFTDFPSLSSENVEYSMSHIHLWDLAVVQEEDSAFSEGSCEAPDHTLEIISCSFLKARKLLVSCFSCM